MLPALPGQDLTSNAIVMEFGVTLPPNLLDSV
ncbi:hypothetical protein FOHLNKBM_0537 [Methylobacterium longum]|nr:hypothetical protein FOHLNKBM_0537 [Methylobacterium longum]